MNPFQLHPIAFTHPSPTEPNSRSRDPNPIPSHPSKSSSPASAIASTVPVDPQSQFLHPIPRLLSTYITPYKKIIIFSKTNYPPIAFTNSVSQCLQKCMHAFSSDDTSWICRRSPHQLFASRSKSHHERNSIQLHLIADCYPNLKKKLLFQKLLR